jgi:DUF2975 family protein
MTPTKTENPSPHAFPAALIVSRIALRILIVLNWIYGAAILGLIIFSFTAESWLLPALKVTEPMMVGMRAVAMLGLVCIPLYNVILRRLLDIVESVRAGDPFVGHNAARLEVIAWALVGLQVLSLIIGAIAKLVSTENHPFHVDAGFSTSGWLSVLLLFVLGRVFAQGARMRDELEGTV